MRRGAAGVARKRVGRVVSCWFGGRGAGPRGVIGRLTSVGPVFVCGLSREESVGTALGKKPLSLKFPRQKQVRGLLPRMSCASSPPEPLPWHCHSTTDLRLAL